MQDSLPTADERHHQLTSLLNAVSLKTVGRALVAVASLGLLLILGIQILHTTGAIAAGFADWRPILYAYLVWSLALGIQIAANHRVDIAAPILGGQ